MPYIRFPGFLVPSLAIMMACMSTPAPTPIPEPTPTPADVPALQEAEVIAVVQTWLSRVPTATGSSCLSLYSVGGSTPPDWTGQYLGNGAWSVKLTAGPYGDGRWRVFEKSLSVSLDHPAGSRMARMGC